MIVKGKNGITAILLVLILFFAGLGILCPQQTMKAPILTTEEEGAVVPQSGLAVTHLLTVTQAMLESMSEGVLDTVRLKQTAPTHSRGFAVFLILMLTIAFLIRWKSGLFTILISGITGIDFLISQIQILHQTDGKKRNLLFTEP